MSAPLFWDLLFPPACLVCGGVCEFKNRALCNKCRSELTLIKHPNLCGICGKPQKSCVCRGEPFAFSHCVSSMIYCEALQKAIVRLKKQPQSPVAQDFAKMMTDALKMQEKTMRFDCVTCVPTSELRKNQRGHNHAETLARLVAKELALPFLPPPLTRSAQSHDQHRLSAVMRIKNAAASYHATGQPVSGHLLLVDDVATTLATLDCCARLLRQSGAAQVTCLTAATTLIHF